MKGTGKIKAEKREKGAYGYFSWEKKRRSAVTLALFLLPVGLFLIGFFQSGSRKNPLTLAAVLGCLPACKSLVGWAIMMPRQSMKKEIYEHIQKRGGNLAMAYDLYFTTYEKNLQVDAAAVGGSTVTLYCSRKQDHQEFIRIHVQDALQQNGCPATVRLTADLQPFLESLDALNGQLVGDGQEKEIQSEIRRTLLAITL